MMENTNNATAIFSLIKGRFNPADANPLISTLYNAKIEFHNRQLLKNSEGSRISPPQEEERIAQLHKSRKDFQDKMKEAIERGCDVEIKGDIEVSFIDT